MYCNQILLGGGTSFSSGSLWAIHVIHIICLPFLNGFFLPTYYTHMLFSENWRKFRAQQVGRGTHDENIGGVGVATPTTTHLYYLLFYLSQSHQPAARQVCAFSALHFNINDNTVYVTFRCDQAPTSSFVIFVLQTIQT